MRQSLQNAVSLVLIKCSIADLKFMLALIEHEL